MTLFDPTTEARIAALPTWRDRIEARLVAQGAAAGTIDAHAAAVRADTHASVARTLRAVAGSPDYDLGDVDPVVIERIAAQIERMSK